MHVLKKKTQGGFSEIWYFLNIALTEINELDHFFYYDLK